MGVCLCVPQLAEVLSRCSHNITETKMTLSNLSSELMKNRDQVHADRRSVGFSSWWGGLGGAQSTEGPVASLGVSLPSPLSWQGCWGLGLGVGDPGMYKTLP